jgi:uncharacterized protein
MNVEAIIIGCITGFISAFFGIGGSSIDTPLLRIILNLPPHIALGTPLPLTLLTATIASLAYKREHLVNFRVTVYSLIGGVPGIVAGSYFSAYLTGKFLMLLTALVLFLVGVDFLYKNMMKKTFAAEKVFFLSRHYIVIVSGLIGILSGVLANGGGIFFVPAYVLLFRLHIKEAIATSLLTVAVMSVPGSIIHYSLGHIDLPTTLALGIGVAPMAYIGAIMDMKTKYRTLMFLFGIMLILFSIYFFISQVKA